MRLLFLCLCLGALAAFPVSWAMARPVSYAGGWTSMIMNDGDANSLHVHYSPTARYSLGYLLEYRRDKDYTMHSMQMNNLLKRWNKPNSQANLYLKSGVGIASKDGETEPAAFTGLAADWENRRYFVSYENRYLHAGGIDDFYTQSARVGVTPYIGDYGDLHTWLMLEVDHSPEAGEPFTVTPLVRLFKGSHLVEAGISNKGDALVNWVVRF